MSAIKFLAVIPARAGSKGLPGKNSKLLNGVPLIFYSINIARTILGDEDICISSNDLELIDIVQKQKKITVPFVRPEDLATDEAGTHEVILHAIEYYENIGKSYDAIILLQPTSPLRTEENLKKAIDLYINDDLDMVVSVKETKSNPYFTLFEEDSQGYLYQSKISNYTRRQDCPKVYEYNGAVYVININSLKNSKMSKFSKIKKYIMSDEESIDIDTSLDWKLAEMILNCR